MTLKKGKTLKKTKKTKKKKIMSIEDKLNNLNIELPNHLTLLGYSAFNKIK